MESQLIQQYMQEVKANKKYSTLADEIVLQEIKEYLRKNPTLKRVDKQSVKDIRAKLHRLYSSYLRGKKSKRDKLLQELKANSENLNLINKILASAVSTKERLDDYQEIYKKIFQITGIPKTIIDLGAGLNPVSFSYMNLEQLNYYSYDIDNQDIDFLNKYFEIMKSKGLNGKAEILNILDFKKIKNLPSTDIVFMFKLLDLINTKNSKPGEELIKYLINNKTKFIIASFSTRTISGKPMNLPKRKGFELMLQRNNLKFQTIKTNNEIFYVIHK